jgi:hypothetical protein
MIGDAEHPADVLADKRFARDIEALHRLGTRAVFEFLVELGQERLLRTDLERRAPDDGRGSTARRSRRRVATGSRRCCCG